VTAQLTTLLRRLRQGAVFRPTAGITDGQLLRRFVAEKDDAAFEALVRQHGPMVLGVCRRVLNDVHEAEDAFQATFLVLVRKAAAIGRRESVGSWLHGVAFRTALKARAGLAARRKHERQVAAMPAEEPTPEVVWRDLRPVLDEEVDRLPKKYRDPVVLCYLEAKSYEEAAVTLGCSKGTLSTRLTRARELLRSRLAARGVTLSSALLGAALAQGAAPAPLPGALVISTVKAAAFFAAPNAAAAGAISAKVAALTEGMVRAMALSKLKTGVVVLLALSLVVSASAVLAPGTPAARQAEPRAEGEWKPISPAGIDGKLTPELSRGWYVLSQTDTQGLLHGLPQRLGKVIVPSRRTGPMWKGVKDGGRVQLHIGVDGGVKGEVFVGFFAEPKWSAEPVQARRFPGPGRYVVDNLMPGKFYVGVMIGLPPHPNALGVHREWPAPVAVQSDQTAEVQIRVSPKFRDQESFGGPGDIKKGFTGLWEKMDPTRLITVRTVDEKGSPVPFCRITLADRVQGGLDKIQSFHNVGTDEKGLAYCDEIEGPFSVVIAQRFDTVPETLAHRSQAVRMPKVYYAEDRPVITVMWKPWPTGTAEVVGRVRDQHGRPLQEFYLTVQREEGERMGMGDYAVVHYHVPVMAPDGRYEVRGLPAGKYTAMVRHFDYQGHDWRFDQVRFTIPEEKGARVRLDIEVEAKELFYGRAVYKDGSPVHPGAWTAWFEKDPKSPSGGRYFSDSLGQDGAFRVALSRKEREALLKNHKGLVEVRAYGKENGEAPGETIEVHIDKLSKDRASPARVILPGKRAEKESRPGAKGQPSEPSPVQDASGTQPAPGQSSKLPKAGMKGAPVDFEVLAADGSTRRLSDYRGKAVLLSVFTLA
jgi:RNA polymerase sigma factor (sigma-70 family)